MLHPIQASPYPLGGGTLTAVDGKRVDNLGKVVTFMLDGEQLTRRLVDRRIEDDAELNVNSPVGELLRFARPGRTLRFSFFDQDSVVKVLSIV